MNQDVKLYIENYKKQKKIIKMNLYAALLDIFIVIISFIKNNEKLTLMSFILIILATACFFMCFIFENLNKQTSKALYEKLIEYNYIKINEKRTTLYTLDQVLRTAKLNLETGDEDSVLENTFNKVTDVTIILKKYPNLTEIVKIQRRFEYIKPYDKTIGEIAARNTKNQIVIVSNRKDIITEEVLI